MDIRTGCDLLHLPKFIKSKNNGGQTFLDKAFTPNEQRTADSDKRLAGIFCAKEAIIKALDMEGGSWQQIEVSKSKSGKPEFKILNEDPAVQSQDLSISHDSDYVMAVATFII